MSNVRTIQAVVFAVFLLSSQRLTAQNPVGYEFLRAFVGARPSAMAGSFVAIPGDIHSIYYNPAGLSALSTRQGTVSYLNHLLDFHSGFFAYAQPLYEGSFGAALNFFDYGTFEGKDANNMDTGEFGATSLSLSLAYAQPVSLVKNLAVGGSAKFIRFQIDDLSATAIAADLGAIYSIPDRELYIGLGVFNVGMTTSAFIESKDELPLNLQLGVAKRLEHLPLFVSATLLKFKGESIDFRVGGEFNLTEQLFLRLGYNSVGQDQKVETSKDRIAGASFGMGFKLNTFNIDYSFSSFGEVGSLNRITLVGRF